MVSHRSEHRGVMAATEPNGPCGASARSSGQSASVRDTPYGSGSEPGSAVGAVPRSPASRAPASRAPASGDPASRAPASGDSASGDPASGDPASGDPAL